jgi:polyhydroxyalkanoate synthesis regulator phasin
MSEEKPQKRAAKKKAVDQSQPVQQSTSSKLEKQEAENLQTGKPAIDPFAQMFQFYDAFAKSWAGVMSEAVASKSFAESMGRQMESGLDAMALLRRQMGDFMEQYLQQMSLPTRKEVINLAERVTNLEMALDDIDAKLDEVLDLLKDKQ